MDIDPEVEFLDHIEVLFLIFWGTSTLFSIAAIVLYIPTNSTQWSGIWNPSAAAQSVPQDSHSQDASEWH